ncbi:MAG: hypothetical protein WEA31_08710, partial [Pirellulales bacterium]
LALAHVAFGQDWRAPGGGETAVPNRYRETNAAEAAPARTATARTADSDESTGREVINATPTGRPTIARVTKGIDVLPNDRGQIWREYDISPYTLRVTSNDKPQQAIIDWILRDTGYEAWHNEGVTVLSADKRTLKVYHDAEIQEAVADIVDRFVNSKAETQQFGVRICTVGSPNWRTRAQKYLNGVPVQSPGVQAWLLAKEDAAVLINDLRRRTDYREHSSPHLMINNGQNAVISGHRPKVYVSGLMPRRDGLPGFEPRQDQINEGYTVDISPLISLDGHSIDAIVKCSIDQVEKMVPVEMEMPGHSGQSQWINVEVPQMTSNRLQERFRWPTDKVLLVSLGVVASPVPSAKLPFSLPLGNGPARADALLFLESKGNMDPSSPDRSAGRSVNVRGRY